jgi:dipeptidase
MCDTVVSVTERGVFFAKNSDREPGEAQAVLHVAATRPKERTLRATHIELPQADRTHELVLSRPVWMWGGEMGANEHGLVIGNEAVFTRIPVAESGLTGMDLLRLALERTKTAEEALELVIWMIAKHGQGGRCGYRQKNFRYHNAFIFADRESAWVLETAGPYWAAERVRGLRTASNVLSIGAEYTRVGPGTVEAARERGFLRKGQPFDFRRAFADRAMSVLSGGDVRRACTLGALRMRPTLDLASLTEVLRDHGEAQTPEGGLRLVGPCAHASPLPTRWSGQTTGSMVAHASPKELRVALTGTSSPCLSVFKPVPLGAGPVDTGPTPTQRFDAESLFWRHERLHRAVLRSYEPRRATFEAERRAMEQRALASGAVEVWREHRERLGDWLARATAVVPEKRTSAFDAYWRIQNVRDGIR